MSRAVPDATCQFMAYACEQYWLEDVFCVRFRAVSVSLKGQTDPTMTGNAAMCRMIIMSCCWSFLADYLWVPAVAYARDIGRGPSFLGLAFALNLGSRLIPNVAITKLGLKSEFMMIAMAG